MSYRIDSGPNGACTWRISDHICAMTDGERHIGHIVRIAGRWHAFDATHLNERKDGFLFLGLFQSREAAMTAIEHGCSSGTMSMAGAA